MTSNEIKAAIRDFVNFDVENNYYQDEDKEENVRLFKKILYEDDVTVRQFLKAFYESSKDLAKEYSLIAKEGEAEEELEDEPEEIISIEEPEDPEEEIPVEEPIEDVPEKKEELEESAYHKAYRTIANNILY